MVTVNTLMLLFSSKEHDKMDFSEWHHLEDMIDDNCGKQSENFEEDNHKDVKDKVTIE